MEELRKLARFLCDLQWEQLPKTVKDSSKMCSLDSIGVAIGALNNEQVQKVSEMYLGVCGPREDVEIWGTDRKAPLLTACFINGMMGHTLELDDVHTDSKTHIGTVVVPAAWAMARYLGRSGKDFLEAVVCGYETMSRIGMALGVTSHRNLGWHVTSTAGTFGAAAACGKLLKLTEDQMVSALGLAGTQSFGTWAFLKDGATNKVLHPAHAADTGCQSALLAYAGMRGPEYILTAEDGGLLNSMTREPDVSKVSKGLGTDWEILQLDNKPYPCCRSTHCTIDGTLALKKEYGITPQEVERIRVDTYLVGNKQCGMSEGSRRPKTPIDAKFSTPYTVAAALLYGKVSLEEFLPEKINDPKVQELLSRVTVETDDEFSKQYPAHWGCRVTIDCKDGRTFTKHVQDASGSAYQPLSAEQVKAKVVPLIESGSGRDGNRVADSIFSLENCETLPFL